ncbi:MAG: hypothetical protein R2860_05000 [Desulfobacterales bacterium]
MPETIAMGELIEKIKQMNILVLLVEHDMDLVMEISDRVAVINFVPSDCRNASRDSGK